MGAAWACGGVESRVCILISIPMHQMHNCYRWVSLAMSLDEASAYVCVMCGRCVRVGRGGPSGAICGSERCRALCGEAGGGVF